MDSSALSVIREFGFPMFVALWFMFRHDRRTDRLFELMSNHMQATALLAKSIESYQLQRNQSGLHVVRSQGDGGKS